MPILKIMRIFTFHNIKSDWKFCANLIKVKFLSSIYNKMWETKKVQNNSNTFKCSYFSLFSSKIIFRRKKMKKPQIIRLFLILHEKLHVFSHFYHIKGDFSWITKSWETYFCIFFVKCFLLYLELKILTFVMVAQKFSVEFDIAKWQFE